MLEKIAPTLLAGVPCIVKPATDGAQLTQAVVKAIEETHVLPKGALQLICGQTYDLLEQLGPQDCVTFTGSAYTGQNYVTTLTSINIRFHLAWKPTR